MNAMLDRRTESRSRSSNEVLLASRWMRGGRYERLGRALMASFSLIIGYRALLAAQNEHGMRALLILAGFGGASLLWAVFWLGIVGRAGRPLAAITITLTVVALVTPVIAVREPQAGSVGNLLVLAMVMAAAAFDGRLGLVWVGALVLMTFALDIGLGLHPGIGISDAAQWMLFGLLTAGVRLLILTLHELDRAREEIAGLAVAGERLRFSRDLHDLLGHRLAVIALRTDAMASQLSAETVERQRVELQEIAAVARTALKETREAVTGYRPPSLDEELVNVRAALQSVGVDTYIENRAGGVPKAAAEVLVWCLREAVTNVIKHAGATRCWIRLEPGPGSKLQLQVADDGRGHRGTLQLGTGLRGILQRATLIGGGAEVQPGGQGFRLRVTVPVDVGFVSQAQRGEGNDDQDPPC